MRESDKILVLLLDDDTTWLRSLSRLLRRRRADCVTFTRPQPILEAMADRLPNVMVIDFVLGTDRTGADVAREMREELRSSCPPLLLVSSSLRTVREEDRAVFDAAFDKHTPIDALVEEILSRSTTKKAVKSRPLLKAMARPHEGLANRKRDTPH